MDCAQTKCRIELFVLGDLSDSEQTAIREHLESCPDCRAVYDECRFLVAQIKGSAQPDLAKPVFKFARDVRSAVKVEIRRASYRATAWRVIPVAGSVAACLLLAFAGWQMWVWSGSGVEPVLANHRRRQPSAEISAAPSVLQVWQHEGTPSAPGSMADAVVVRGDNMYLLQTHDRHNYVAALDTRTGEQKWLSDVQSCGYLLADDMRVYCLTRSETSGFALVALDATDGALLWKHHQEHSDRLQGPCRACLLGTDRICWTADRTVYMLSRANGDPIWTRSIPDEGMLSAPVGANNNLYIASAFGLYCLDANTGNESWRLACSDVEAGRGRPMLAAADGKIYASIDLGLHTNRLLCMNAAQPRILWSKIADGAARLDAIGDVLYVRDQNILALEATTGRLLWKRQAEGCNPVTYAEDLAYFVDSSDRGKLVALDRHTGARVWELPGMKSCDAFIRVDSTGFLKTPDGLVRAFIFEG